MASLARRCLLPAAADGPETNPVVERQNAGVRPGARPAREETSGVTTVSRLNVMERLSHEYRADPAGRSEGFRAGLRPASRAPASLPHGARSAIQPEGTRRRTLPRTLTAYLTRALTRVALRAGRPEAASEFATVGAVEPATFGSGDLLPLRPALPAS